MCLTSWNGSLVNWSKFITEPRTSQTHNRFRLRVYEWRSRYTFRTGHAQSHRPLRRSGRPAKPDAAMDPQQTTRRGRGQESLYRARPCRDLGDVGEWQPGTGKALAPGIAGCHRFETH